jgi:DNA-binding response OmpR family regulator
MRVISCSVTGERGTVLVADDSNVARYTLARALKGAGFAVVEASSVTEAQSVDTSSLHAAILDLDLGDGSGVELFLSLRDQRADLPMAFFSGGAEDDRLAQAVVLAPVFDKPTGLSRLVAWVQELASEQR